MCNCWQVLLPEDYPPLNLKYITMIIIGITGTLGAGKGTIVDYLKEQHGFHHFSVRNYLIKLLNQEGKPLNRGNMVELANRLRAANGPSFIAEELYREAALTGENSIIESIRTTGEIDALRARGKFWLFAVDADPALRYERICERKSETDQVDYATFLSDEKREMEATDPNKQNLKACIDRSDFLFSNNGSFEELYKQIEHAVTHIQSR